MTDAARGLQLPSALPLTPGGAVVTVGTFDGVHRGHLAVLDVVRREAERRGARSVVVTFEPHPLRIINPEAAPRLLTTPEEKRELLEAAGLDHVVVLPFTRALANCSASEFVEEILIGRLRMVHLVIGYDHGLGRGRSGDVDALRRIGGEVGFGVDVVPAVLVEGEPISSTRIRAALEQGDIAFAAAGLGRPYSLSGRVVRGEGLGRRLGFPTANLEVSHPDKLLPREGIYAIRAALGEECLEGVLHLGPRPVFEGLSATVELHLFDFDRDIYGEALRVEFCAWLREILPFRSVADLVDAIRGDCAAARRLFAEGGGACQSACCGLK